jgi:hypothetical protein
MPPPTGTSEVATLGPLGAAAVLLAVVLGVGEGSADGELAVGLGEAGADDGGAELVGAVVSASGEQAPRTAAPPPLSAARPAARRTVRRVVAVEEDRWLGSGIRSP